MVEKYELNLKKSKDVNARIYKVYEDDKIILQSIHLEDINELKIDKNKNLEIVIEPEVVGIKLVMLLLLSLISAGIDKNFFMSFFNDSIEIQQYPFDKLNLNYVYSFHESFSVENGFINKQKKVILSKNFYTLLMMIFIPITLVMMYCITMLLLGTEYFMLRISLVTFLCILQFYLSYQIYRLNKFRQS